MELLNISSWQGSLKVFLLVLSRTGGVFLTAPLFRNFVLPRRFRIIISLFVAFIIHGVYTQKFQTISYLSQTQYLLILVSEVLIGIIIGFIADIFMTIFESSAQFYNIQLGFGMMDIISPLTQTQMPLFGQLLSLLGLYAFIIIDGPSLLIKTLSQSYLILPLFDFKDFNFVYKIVEIFSKCFIIAFKLALPMVGILFLVVLSIALLSKAAPMIHIFAIGWQITLIVGFVTLFFLMPILFKAIISILWDLPEHIKELLFSIKR
jgi:flagellar biosynthetic protein FliR